MGGTSVDLDVALSTFQQRLLVALAEGNDTEAGVEASLPFAYERNRQLDEMRSGMLRVLELIDR